MDAYEEIFFSLCYDEVTQFKLFFGYFGIMRPLSTLLFYIKVVKATF